MKAATESQTPKALRATLWLGPECFTLERSIQHRWLWHSCKKWDHGSQAVCAKAMEMAFYDNARREMSCSGVLKVNRGLSHS